MKKLKKQFMDKKKIEEMLLKENLCRIALCDNGVPYIIPMNYGYRDNALFLHCAPEGRKLDIMRRNNLVGFEVESDITAPPVRYKCVIGLGRVSILRNREDVDQALDILCSQFDEKFQNWRELCSSKRRDRTIGLRIDILEMKGKQRRYGDSANSKHAH